MALEKLEEIATLNMINEAWKNTDPLIPTFLKPRQCKCGGIPEKHYSFQYDPATEVDISLQFTNTRPYIVVDGKPRYVVGRICAIVCPKCGAKIDSVQGEKDPTMLVAEWNSKHGAGKPFKLFHKVRLV